MSLFLFLQYASKLTREQEQDIDRSVLKNCIAVSQFVKKIYKKGKIVLIKTTYGIAILASTPKIVYANNDLPVVENIIPKKYTTNDIEELKAREKLKQSLTIKYSKGEQKLHQMSVGKLMGKSRKKLAPT